MSYNRGPMRSRLAFTFVVAGILAAACGNSDATNRDYGAPPDPSKFNPGSGDGDDPYGYGGSQTGASVVVCPPELERCPHTVTYPFNGESNALTSTVRTPEKLSTAWS